MKRSELNTKLIEALNEGKSLAVALDEMGFLPPPAQCMAKRVIDETLTIEWPTTQRVWEEEEPSVYSTVVFPITKLAQDIHEVSKAKDWWKDGDRNPLEILMLITSELAEAAEEFRNGKPAVYYNDLTGEVVEGVNMPANIKPEGWAVEIADAIIRCLDYTAQQGVDIGAIVDLKNRYNKTRPARHGGKKF